ncbi:MAG: 7-cyano-7-deazaguanine synthase QueC [Acidobacteriaceae bacterium]
MTEQRDQARSIAQPASRPDSDAPRRRAVVCLSGGMDSTVCAALAARDYDTYALHFSYGQRTEGRELRSAQAVADALGVKQLLPLSIDLFRLIGGSALTDPSIAVPNAPEDAAGIGSVIPITYVPFRNAHFLAAAVSWAEVLCAEAIFIGAVEQDSSGYPDCRPAYYEAFQRLIAVGTRDGSIHVETPLIRMRKHEIVRLGLELSAPFHVTWSCYSGEEIACGTCESCILRLRAFAEAGYDDPIPYATNWKRTENVSPANVRPENESSGNESPGTEMRGETHV